MEEGKPSKISQVELTSGRVEGPKTSQVELESGEWKLPKHVRLSRNVEGWKTLPLNRTYSLGRGQGSRPPASLASSHAPNTAP